jgi:alpha-L-fucosidase
MHADWFKGAGLGLFIHWDHASQQGLEISWPMVGFNSDGTRISDPITIEQYNSSAATFNPVNWDARALASLARDCGFRYAVFTSKHHTGYCMFHTKLTEFSVENSPYGKDLVREYVDAFRAVGLKVGLYYSISDWHHPDYPRITARDLPYVVGQTPPFPGDETWSRYLAFLFAHLTELLTNYGQIDLIWFDGDWERTPAQWHVREIAELVRSLQPDILINDRLPQYGDFATPEQIVPGSVSSAPWESCMTMNETWAYDPHDHRYKSVRTLLQRLIETVANGGNLLLDVSPRGDGTLPPEQSERLKAIGSWLERNGASIFRAGPGLAASQFYGPTTMKGNVVYLHLLSSPPDVVDVREVPVKRIKKVVELSSQEPLTWRTRVELHGQTNVVNEPMGSLEIDVTPTLRRDEPVVIGIEFDPPSTATQG